MRFTSGCSMIRTRGAALSAGAALRAIAFVLGVEALGSHFAAARFAKDEQFHVRDTAMYVDSDHIGHRLVFADGILHEGVAIDLRPSFADVDLKGIFGEFPADTFFNRHLLIRGNSQNIFFDALGLWKHQLDRLFLTEEDFGHRHFLFRQIAFDLTVPHPFSPDHGRGHGKGECQ